MPGDEELGFEAAVAALGNFHLSLHGSVLDKMHSFCLRSDLVLMFWITVILLGYNQIFNFSHWFVSKFNDIGMKTTVSEAEHPLLCEGTRRVKGDLALALMITYKDDQCKLKKVTITSDY